MNDLGFHCQKLGHLEERLLANGLRRGEFYNFPAEQLPLLKKGIISCGIAASIHCPLENLSWYPDPPTWAFLCDLSRERRELNLRMVEVTIQRAGDIGAEYVVAHFPSPASDAPHAGYSQLQPIALDSCQRLELLSEGYGVPVHLEGFGPTPLLNPDFLVEVFTHFRNLKYCFDTGHMGLAAKRDGLDLYRFAERLAPYVGSIHLWNTRGLEDYFAFRHIPVHPAQKPEAGWVDIERLLRLIRKDSPTCPIVFESLHRYPLALGDYDYRDGVRWIKGLVTSF